MKKNMNIEWAGLNMGRRRFLQGATAIGAAAAMGGLPKPAWSADGGTLRVRAYSDLKSLDPAFSSGLPGEAVQAPIYNKLIQYKPGSDWGWQLDAATSIEQVDPTHIKFALRDDIGFTNGYGAMTAEDVKYSFERVIDPELDSPNKPDMGTLSHVEVTGEREGVIVLKEPFAPLWSIALPHITGNIISRKAFQEAGGRITTSAVTASGPYMFKEWQPRQKVVLVRNPDWKGTPAAFDSIEILPIDDENSAEIAFEAGELDFTAVPVSSVERLRGAAPRNGVLKEYPSLYYVWLGMNLDNPKLQNPKLRQAIQHAINVPMITEAAYFGIARPSTGLIAPGLVGHREQSLIPEAGDLEKARQLLEESGETNVSLTLDVNNTTTFVTAAQIIQANLAEIGIALEVNVHEAATFWTLGEEASGDRWKNLELVLNRFSMLPDPYYATSWFTCAQVGKWNWERYCSKEFDALHDAAAIETDTQKRDEMYRKAQDMMEETGAYRFLTHEATAILYNNAIQPALRPDGFTLLRYFEKA